MMRNIFYCLSITLVLLTPFMYSHDLYNGLISAKQIWFYGAMGGLVFVLTIDILFSRGQMRIGFNIVDISLLVFYSYYFIRACYTPYTPILYNQKFLNYTLLVLFYFIVKHACTGAFSKSVKSIGREQGANLPIQIITLVLMLTGLIEAIWGLMQLYGFTRSFHSGFNITGTFFNPAPYALYLAAVFPIALTMGMKELRNERTSSAIKELRNERMKEYLMRVTFLKFSTFISVFRFLKLRFTENSYFLILSFFNSFIKIIAFLTVISILLVLPATMNRASWVGVGVSSFFVFNQRYSLIDQARGWLKTGARKIIATAGILVIVISVIVGLYHLKAGSSIGKLFIWEVTAGKIGERPLFGHGVGRFEAEYNNWQAEYFKNHPEEMEGPKGMAAGNTKYCFNEYLEMASEIGVIGMVLFLMVFLSLLISRIVRSAKLIGDEFSGIRITRIARSAKLIGDEFSRKLFIGSSFNPFISSNSFILSFLHSFISLFVCALISYPFYSLSTMILLFLLLGMISSGIPVTEKYKLLQVTPGFQYVVRLASLFLLAPVLFFLFNLAKEQYRNGFAMDEGIKLYQIQSYKEACQSFEEVYPSLKYNGPYLQYYGKALSMKGDFDKSVEILEQARHFTSDEILYTNLGSSYDTLKRYPEAESAYLHASAMVPHKFYPLYLLANLYEVTGQKSKAATTAEKILIKRIKVESSATGEIIGKMKSLLEIIQTKEHE